MHGHESYKLEGSNGTSIEFLKSEIALLNRTNYGTAPIEYQTTRGFLQDGANIVRYQLGVRTLTFELFVSADKFKTKLEYWNYRDTLINIFNPLSAPLTFTITKDDGSARQLTNLYPINGINFLNVSDWNISETITLNAYTPYWVDAAESSFYMTEGLANGFIFPITFPVTFGGDGANYIKEFTSNELGNWKIYPTITITGAYNTVTLENSWNAATITLFVSIADNEKRTIYLSPNNIRVIDGDGNNKIDELTIDSNLINFYLNPSIDNKISASLTGKSANTNIHISFNKTYIGI